MVSIPGDSKGWYDREVGKLVAELSPDASNDQIISTLSTISTRISRISSIPDVYSQVSQALLDKVCPSLLHGSPPFGNDVWMMFEGFFLHGNHAIAFRDLCGALNLNSDVGEVVARILVLFVSRKTGGVSRLTEVLSKPIGSDQVSFLLHLPSRVINVLLSSSLTEYNSEDLVDENDYFDTLSEAIYNQPSISDIERERVLKDLVARMVTMKRAETLIHRFLCFGDIGKIVQLISLASHRSTAPLTRALLNQRFEANRKEKLIHDCLCKLLRQSPVALDCCIHVLPFQQPVFKRPKRSIGRLVRAVIRGCETEKAEDALVTASEVWSGEEFASSEDIAMQRQVTRTILYYLKYLARSPESVSSISNTVMMVLVDGVHARLSANDARARRHGMVIGEASSRFCKDEKVLKFEREESTNVRRMEKETIGDERLEDGGDTDFSELAEHVGQDISNSEEEEREESDDNEEEKPQNEGAATKESTSSGGQSEDNTQNLDKSQVQITLPEHEKSNGRKRLIWPQSNLDEEWQYEDDWSSIESFSMTSSSEDGEDVAYSRRAIEKDYVELRKKLSAPMSVPRLLGLLIEINKSDGGSTVVDANVVAAALRTLASRAESNFTTKGTLRSAAAELCMEIVRIDPERYPDVDVPELAAARSEAFHKVVQMDIGSCGSALVERIICGKTSDMQHRLEALAVLAKTVRSAHDKSFNQTETSRQLVGGEDKSVIHVGESTRVLKHSLNKWRARQQESAKAICSPNWDVEGISKVFHGLASRLCEGGGASFVQIEERDVELWAQGMLTLATLACYAGSGAQGAELRYVVIEIAMRRVLRLKADSAVRRALALALSIVIEGMDDREVREILVGGASDVIILPDYDDVTDVGREAFEWLQRAAEGDADIGVRRFAALTLRKWSQRVEVVLK